MAAAAASTAVNALPTGTSTSTSSPSATTGTCQGSITACGIASAGTLYIFTFIGTVVLLTLLAGTLVSRSVYIRRRQQRLIASGVLVLPPPPSRQVKADVGPAKPKPCIYDAHIELSRPLESEEKVERWETMQPFAAEYMTSMASELESQSGGTLSSMVPPSKMRACVACIVAMPFENPVITRKKNGLDWDSEDDKFVLPVSELGVAVVDVAQSGEDTGSESQSMDDSKQEK